MDILYTERLALRRALQIARTQLEHEVRHWEYPPNEVLANHKREIDQFSLLLAKFDQAEKE